MQYLHQLVVVYFAGVTALSAVVPQALFKSSERVLTLNSQGWATTIGRKAGSCPWSDVSEVRDDHHAGLVIQGKNGNALLVPARAFSGEAERNRIMAAVVTWKNNS